MSNEGFQIEIPNFDDEDNSGSVPFGSRGAFGQASTSFGGASFGGAGQASGGFGGQSFGQSGFGQSFGSFGANPVPLGQAESFPRSGFHVRGDSATSDTSNRSFQFGTHHEPSGSLSQSTSSVPRKTVTTTHTSSSSLVQFPSRKSSFASLKNAFKSKSSHDPPVPPVPIIDHQAYPALRNPFARSTSSLNNNTPSPLKEPKRRTIKSSSQSRATPPPPATAAFARVRAHSHAKSVSAHSHTSSIARSEFSDLGQDHSPGPSNGRVPPVPPVPDEYGNGVRRHHATSSGISDSSGPVIAKPQKPHEYALHVVFTKFLTSAEQLVLTYISQSLLSEASLNDLLGPGRPEAAEFDSLLESMAQLARKHSHPVIDAVMRWRKAHKEQPLDNSLVERQFTHHREKFTRVGDVAQEMLKRKELATIYVLCRALIVVLRSVTKEGLDERFGDQLESTFFEEFVTDPDMKLLSHSPNHRANAELYTMVLGEMANTRFQSVTDRFLQVLAPLAAGQVLKDGGLRYENIIRGLEYIKLRVWPTEAFDEGAEFLESLSKAFANAHGQRLKTAFSNVLTKLLLPIGKEAMAEVNHPLWGRAMEVIFTKSKEMKPRYWIAAYPLMITSLCLAPHDLFLRNWSACLDLSISKLKEKSNRTLALNAIVRLIWTYLFRCNESSSTVTAKLDAIRPAFFPPKRKSVNPPDDGGEALTCIVHFILFRHFDYGSDVVLELLQESTVHSLPSNPSTAAFIDGLSTDRISIALRAILRTIDSVEKNSSPPWPSSTSFTTLSFADDYPSSASALPESVLLKPGMPEFIDQVGPIITKLVSICGQAVGNMSVLDMRYRYQQNLPYEEREDLIVKQHSQDIVVTYSYHLVPHIELLTVCFDSWPRCLRASANLTESFDLLIKVLLHVDPQLSASAEKCLRRFVEDDKHVKLVLARFTRFLFAPFNLLRDGSTSLNTSVGFVQQERLTALWADLVECWRKRSVDGDSTVEESAGIPDFDAPAADSKTPLKGGKVTEKPINTASLIEDLEAGGLYLLVSTLRALRVEGIRVLRVIPDLMKSLVTSPARSGGSSPSSPTFSRVIDILERKGLQDITLPGQSLPLGDPEHDRLSVWREGPALNALIQLAESKKEIDNKLWRFVLPSITRSCLQCTPSVFQICRDSITAAVLRCSPRMSSLADIQSKSSGGQFARSPPASSRGTALSALRDDSTVEVEQWRSWIVFLCSSAMATDPRVSPVRDHYRVPSDSPSQRERLATARGLFQHLIPFLNAEEHRFRSGVIQALGCILQGAFRTLLEDLQSLRRMYDDVRSPVTQKNRRARPSGKLHTAVMQIYRLTAHFAKDTKTITDQATLTLMLQFVKETKTYLSEPDARLDLDALRLRRFFCGVVEYLFDGMSVLKDSERFSPPGTRLTLFRLCQEWCADGASPAQRRRFEESLATPRQPDTRGASDVAQQKVELERLSAAASGAMTSLLSVKFFSGESADTSADGKEPGNLDIGSTFDWLSAVFISGSGVLKKNARKALRSLLIHPACHATFFDEVLNRAFLSTELTKDRQEYYDVIVDIIIDRKEHPYTFGQIVCVALSNLGHPAAFTRGRAFDVLEELVLQEADVKILAPLEASVRNPDAIVYLDAQQKISNLLAHFFPQYASAIIAQCALQLPRPRCDHRRMLRALAPWTSVISLLSEDNTLPAIGFRTLVNLFSLTVRFIEEDTSDVQALWENLVSNTLPNNTTAVIKFLMEQSIERGSIEFLTYAQRIVAGMSSTEMGPIAYEELCSVVDTLATGVAPELLGTTLSGPEEVFTADLNALVPCRTRLSLGTGQVALLLLGNVSIGRAWDFRPQLPVLLQAVLCQVDHPQPFVRTTARSLLFRTIRSWIPGYDEIPSSVTMPSRTVLKATVTSLENRQDELFWPPAEDSSQPKDPSEKLQKLCSEILEVLEPLFPQLRQTWGEVALDWGTTCPVPATARRSIQILRALMPDVGHSMIASMLHRLSNTIADSNRHFQAFAKEILMTLTSFTRSVTHDLSLLPTIFWAATACLSSMVESEFLLAVELFDSLLDKLDLHDPSVVECIDMAKPAGWAGHDGALYRLVIAGMRSSTTAPSTLNVLMKIAKLPDLEILDPARARLRLLYTVSLPWCLDAMEKKVVSPELAQFALDISAIAKESQKTGISRIMTSCAKNRFRTKDDFLRQAVGCLREYFMSHHSTEVVTILLGMVLNNERWLRIRSMQILKLLFGHAETRNPLILHGSDLLMPLLRLVTTDLAQQALEVLDEPLAVTGGPAATQVLRMSMHAPATGASGSSGEMFGLTSETGWCIPNPEELSEACRHNVLEVCSSFQDVAPPHPISMVMFQNGDVNGNFGDRLGGLENGMAMRIPSRESLSDAGSVGELVNTLHDLGEFFQSHRQPPPSNVEERVAMILSRSLANSTDRRPAPVRNHSVSSLSEWIDGESPTFPPPTTPGPFLGLFSSTQYSSPQDSTDNLRQTYDGGSDDDESDYGDVPTQHESSRQPFVEEDDEDSDDDVDAFALEDTTHTPERSMTFREMLASRLTPKSRTRI